MLGTGAITLGYAQITSNVTTTSTSPSQATGLTATVIIPAGGRKVKITVYTSYLFNLTTSATSYMQIWDGTVGSGALLNQAQAFAPVGNTGSPATLMAVVTPAAGSKTYNVGFQVASSELLFLLSSS
jgi:hypothetical protein